MNHTTRAIKSSEELKMAIYELEAKAIIQREELRQSIHGAIESVKPGKYIKATLHNIVSPIPRRESNADTIIGLGIGIALRKLVAKMPGGIFKNTLATLIQFGLTSTVSKLPEVVKALNHEVSDDEDSD